MRADSPPDSSLLTLRKLPAGYRVLYTAVLACFALGHATGLIEQQLRAGLTPRGAAEWILGNEDDPDAAHLLFPRDAAAVLDDVWRRSLADVIPTVVTLALVFRAGGPGAARATLGSVLFGTALLDMTGPALVRALGPALGWVWWSAQITLTLGICACAALCVGEMWRLRASGSRFRQGIPTRA